MSMLAAPHARIAEDPAAPPEAMTVLVVGASGMVGAEVTAALNDAGYSVTAVVRDARASAATRLAANRLIALDLREAISPARWEDVVKGIEAVVYCAGALQDSGRDDVEAVHLQAPSALCAACERAGVRRFIHFSAMNADQPGLTTFSRTKNGMEQRLEDSGLNYVILRPSVIIAPAAYGGSALFRGLAALPWLPRQADAGRLSIVQLDDVVATVLFFLQPAAPGRLALDLAGPEALTFEDVVARFRHWLGHPPARVLPPSPGLMRVASLLADIAGAMGWRTPMRSTALKEMKRGAAGSGAQWSGLTGITPTPLALALRRSPASVQERWFSNLYFLKPLALVVFAGFFMLTGIVALGPGYDIGVAMMQKGGAGPLSGPSVVAGAIADIVIAWGILWRRTARLALWGAVGLTVFYVVAGTLLLPGLWSDPLGPMMKVWPIFALNFILLAILEER